MCAAFMPDLLSVLYQTVPGRLLLRPLASRPLSQAVGAFLDTPLSLPLIPAFLRLNHISLEDYETAGWHCFNDCFCRRLKPGRRPIDQDPRHLIAPCDGLLSVYPIREGLVLPVKQSHYTIASLLQDDALARRFREGFCFVFRLCVHHYHRYCYADSGQQSFCRFIPGRLHTVRPIALSQVPVFVENCRAYTVIDSLSFGPLVQMEVGAMLVGRIDNYHHGQRSVRRGEEKGRFLYGGSTIILLTGPNAVAVPEAYLKLTADGRELPVKMGQRIAPRI